MLNKIAVRDEDGFIVLVPRDEYMRKHSTKCAYTERVVDNIDTVKIGEYDIVPIEDPGPIQQDIYSLGAGAFRLTNTARYRISNVCPSPGFTGHGTSWSRTSNGKHPASSLRTSIRQSTGIRSGMF